MPLLEEWIFYEERNGLALYRTLLPGVVDGVIGATGAGEDQLRNGDEGVAVLEQGLDDAGQGLWSMFGGVVEEDNRAGLHFGGNPLGDLSGGEVLPVQTITAGNKGKCLGCGWELSKETFAVK